MSKTVLDWRNEQSGFFQSLRVYSRPLRAALRRFKNNAFHLVNRSCLIPTSVGISRTCRNSGRELIVVHVQETGLSEHIEPVVKWLHESQRCLIIVVVSDFQQKSYRDSTQLPFEESPFLMLLSERQFSGIACAPRVIVSLHPETPSSVAQRFANGQTCRVVMQHGLSDKAVFMVAGHKSEDRLTCYDVVFLSSPTVYEGSLREYSKRFPESYRRLQFMNVGSPKTDTLFHPDKPRESLLSNLGLDPTRKVVCYAPTLERTASLETHGVEIIRALGSLPINVIVKLHHFSLKTPTEAPWVAEETGGKNWKQIVEDLQQELPNVRLANGQNANPYLKASDLLVSDASGVAFEFLLLDRPLVFFDVPELFKQYGTEGIHYWGRECGEIVSDTDELVVAVKRSLDDPLHKSSERKEIQERIIYSKGQATATAGRAILELVQRS